MCPDVECAVMRQRAFRLTQDSPTIVEQRKGYLTKLYGEYKQTLLPSAWWRLPEQQCLYNHPAMNKLIFAEANVIISEQDVQNALADLPDIVTKWQEKQRKEWVSYCPSWSDFKDWLPKPKHQHAIGARTKLQPRELATVVSLCYICPCPNGPFFGEEGIFCLHRCSPWVNTVPELFYQSASFNEGISKFASVVIEMAGLDPATAQPEDLDSMEGLRFQCIPCTERRNDGYTYAYTWRGLVSCSLLVSVSRASHHAMHTA
jgi:hypothetical protein